MTVQDERVYHHIAKVLGLENSAIQNHHNFFKLGGDSLSALELVRLAKKEDVHLTVDLIFQNPTISDLIKISGERAGARDTLIVKRVHEQKQSRMSSPVEHEHEHERECEQASNHPSDVVRVLPTTEFQKLTLSWMHYRYFWMPLPSAVDTSRLLNACQMLALRHESLRTAFTLESHGRECKPVQVIFPSIDVQLKEVRGVHCLEQHCNEDTRNSVEPPVDGKPPFQAHLVTLQDSRIYLVLRFVHAQWDGCSLASIADDLSGAYNRLPLPPTTPYSQHARVARLRRTDEAYSTWKQVLNCSRMTTLQGDRLPLGRLKSERRSKGDDGSYVVQATKRIPNPSLPPRISMATLVKTAWAVTLMRFFAEQEPATLCGGCESRAIDVVFGQATSGRGLGIPHEKSIIGPCVTIVPVRVRITGPTTSKMDLLHQVQQQYLQTRPYENLEFGDIVKHCTSWHPGTKFGSIVRFQNHDFSPTTWFDGVPCNGTLYYLPNKPSETANLAVFPLGSELSLLLTVANHAFDQEEADFVIDEFCKIIEELSFGGSPVKCG